MPTTEPLRSRACATARVRVPWQKIRSATGKSPRTQTDKHFSKRKGKVFIPSQPNVTSICTIFSSFLSSPDNFSSPYLWLCCSLFPESPFFICECLNPTQCLLQMPYPPKYFPDFPAGTISSASKLLSLITLPSDYLCMIQNSSWCTGTNMGFVFTSLSCSLHPPLLCPLNPSTAVISLAVEFRHTALPLFGMRP